MLATLFIRHESRIVTPLLVAHHFGDARKQAFANNLRDQRSVFGFEQISRRAGLATIAEWNAIGLYCSLFDQGACEHPERTSEQGCLYVLPLAGCLALPQC